MSYDNLKAEYNVVSVEMSNPFAKLGDFSLDKFRKFSTFTSEFMQRTLSLIDISHANGLYVSYSPEVGESIRTKKVVYSDLQPVQVFVPDFLKSNTKMLDYALALTNDLKLCSNLTKSAPEELEHIANGYLGNPLRLKDPILINIPSPDGLSLAELDKELNTHRQINEKILTATGSSSIRQFKDAYARIADFTHTNGLAMEINNMYKEHALILVRYMKRVDAANNVVGKLIDKLQNDPNFEVSGAVASHLSKQVYRLAILTEFYGATLYNAQVFLKALSDTNIALQRVTQ